MQQTTFEALKNAQNLNEVLALIPPQLEKGEYAISVSEHLTKQYAKLEGVQNKEWAMAWTKSSVGYLLKATHKQQKALNPLLLNK